MATKEICKTDCATTLFVGEHLLDQINNAMIPQLHERLAEYAGCYEKVYGAPYMPNETTLERLLKKVDTYIEARAFVKHHYNDKYVFCHRWFDDVLVYSIQKKE